MRWSLPCCTMPSSPTAMFSRDPCLEAISIFERTRSPFPIPPPPDPGSAVTWLRANLSWTEVRVVTRESFLAGDSQENCPLGLKTSSSKEVGPPLPPPVASREVAVVGSVRPTWPRGVSVLDFWQTLQHRELSAFFLRCLFFLESSHFCLCVCFQLFWFSSKHSFPQICRGQTEAQ